MSTCAETAVAVKLYVCMCSTIGTHRGYMVTVFTKTIVPSDPLKFMNRI